MADSGTYDDATLQRRYAMAQALMAPRKEEVRHWAQGLDQLAKSAAGGLMFRSAEEERKANEEQGKRDLLAILNPQAAASVPGAPAAGTSPVSAATPMGALPGMSNTVGKIYGNDEPSPLDPPSGADRDRAIRTVVAEAGNQGPVGMNAVASVIRNRAVNGGYGGDTPSGVVTAPNQFEPWNNMSGRSRMAGIDPSSPAYQAAGSAVDQAYAGNDPTNGALNFYSPTAQAALGRPAPAWDNGRGVDIGQHRFFGGAPQNPVAAALTTPQAPAATPAAPDNRAQIAQLLMSKNPTARAVGTAMLQQQLKPQEYGFQVQPDGTILRTDPKRGTVEPVYQGATKPTFGVIGKDEFGNEQYGFIDAAKGKTTPVETPKSAGTPGTVTGPDGKPIPIPPGVDPKKFRTDVTSAVADAATGKKTEVQAKAEQFANRMEKAEASIAGGLENEGTGVSGAAQQIAGSVPVVGSALQTKNYQKYDQAKSQFITALLRQESGAAIGKQEFSRYEKEFFPQPGDAPETIQQKAEARKVAIEAMKKGAGPAYKSPDMPKPPEAKRVTKTIGGKNYYQENGQWFEE